MKALWKNALKSKQDASESSVSFSITDDIDDINFQMDAKDLTNFIQIAGQGPYLPFCRSVFFHSTGTDGNCSVQRCKLSGQRLNLEILQIYEELLEKFPGSSSLLAEYAHFCDNILNDEGKAERHRERAALLESATNAGSKTRQRSR
jgi:hypothetical protein